MVENLLIKLLKGLRVHKEVTENIKKLNKT